MNPKNIFFIVLALGGSVSYSHIAHLGLFSKLKQRPRQSVRPVRTKQMPNWKKQLRPCSSATNRCERADLSVRADVTKNEVTLSGTVESEAVRSKAVELAKIAHVGVVVK